MNKSKKTIYTSLKQCSSATGYSVEILKRAKHLAAAGFKSDGRINWDEASEWLKLHIDELQKEVADHSGSQTDWKTRKLKGEALLIEFKLEAEKGKYISKEDVAAQLLAICQATKAIIKDTLEVQLPPKLIGLSQLDITEIMKKTTDDICAQFQQGLNINL